MVQFKALTTFLIASAVILPSLAVPVNMGLEDLALRDYDDALVERAINIEALVAREMSDDIELEARDPSKAGERAKNFFKSIGRGLGKVVKTVAGVFLRDDTDDVVARDNSFEDLD
jgi:hypothetical protein